MLPNPQSREVTLEDYFKVIKKRHKIIAAFLIIIPLAVAILVFAVKPVYRATVSVLIEKSPPKVTQFEEVYQTPYGDTLQYYQTQYKILSSRALTERVFEELRLIKDKDFKDARDPIRKLYDSISIEPVRNSQIVMVHVDDTDPLRASSIANAFAKEYIKQDIETRNLATKQAAGWLESQLVDIKKRMEESEKELSKYIQQNRIVTVPDVERKTETLLESLKQDKSNVETALAEALKRYKEKHPKIIALRAQAENINAKIEKETENLLNLQLKMAQYNMLKKETESSQQLYTSILSRAKETDVSEKIEASRIRVIDPAKVPDIPFRPKKLRDILLSIFVALMAGVGAAFFLEYLDSTIRTAEDVRVYVNLPFLGYISTIGKDIKTEIDKDLLCYKDPKCAISEAYRVIRTSILFASPEDKPLKNILVTSSLPKEGKTFTATNIATIFSQLNEKVILIDLDMRRGRLANVFNVEQKAGISDFLAGKAELKDIIKKSFVGNLSIISSGTIPPNPSELLHSGKVALLFEELKARFDRIIIDAPPILSVADSSLLANIVDGVIMVIKGASSHLNAITQTKGKIIEAKGRIIRSEERRVG
ncbi:MAG: polysaccharide biosynthesis tyrosine autokinase, partial [Candidatus Omnitrophica bacterium]|nr:polysaccharide biosynthesis tyrosine autokinase [Candidatus Omnitrophota bacterium]